MKSVGIGYLLAGLGLLTPFAGLHRFYLGKWVSGFLYLITWGFLGIGTVVDIIRLEGMVEDANDVLRRFPAGMAPARLSPPSEEQRILAAAEKREGRLTITLASLETGLPLKRCETLLDRMSRDGFCRVDVNEEGDRLYEFTGLTSTKPFTLD